MADFEPSSLVLELLVAAPEPLEDPSSALTPGFQAAARELYPKGDAWNTETGSTTAKVLDSIAQAMLEVELQALALARETTPELASKLLAEWERAMGLPDPCLGPGSSEEERRTTVVRLLVGMQGFSAGEIASYVLGAVSLTLIGGGEPPIQHFTPCRAGFRAGTPCYGIPWVFTIAIHYWGSGSRQQLECAVRRITPAHAVVLFYYGEFTPDFVSSDLIIDPQP